MLISAGLTGDRPFARSFFDRYILGQELPDLKSLLGYAGFELKKIHPGRAVIDWGQNKLRFEEGRAVVSSNTFIGTPLYEAGIDRGDILLSIGGTLLRNARELQRLLASKEPGETVSVSYESLGRRYESEMRLAEDPALELVTFEATGKELTAEIKTFRHEWLGSRAKR